MHVLLTVLLFGAAVLAGGGLAVQSAVNAQLRTWLSHPVLAALVSFVVGTAALAVAALASGATRPRPDVVHVVLAAPWWVWLGGVLGAYFVLTAVVLTPRLGPALYFGLLVAGQLLTSLLLEHFGAIGLDPHPVNVGRVASDEQ
jgi:transporter family-2 protein